MRLLEYYVEVVHSVGLTFTEDNYLSVDGKEKILYEGLPIALPTKEHIKTIKRLSDNGNEMVLAKHLFNPLSESVTDGLNPGMTVLKNKIEMSTDIAIEAITHYLIEILNDKEKQKSINVKLLKFMDYLSEYHKKGNRSFINKETEKTISKLFENKSKMPIIRFDKIPV